MKSLFLILIFITQMPALASTPPWELVDQAFKKPNLCAAILDGRRYKMSNKSCSKFGCDEWNYYIETHCVQNENGTSSAIISHLKSDGKKFAEDKFNDIHWQSFNGNLLRARQKYLEGQGYYLDLEKAEITGDLLHVEFSILKGANTAEIGFWDIRLNENLPVIEQILVRQGQTYGFLAQTNTQSFLKIED